MKVEETKWPEMKNGNLLGFADILVNECVEVRGCALRKGKEGDLWIAVPSRKYEDEEGKTKWVGHIGFPVDADYTAFQQASVKALTTQINEETFNADDIPF